jgi:hypothetical protein
MILSVRANFAWAGTQRRHADFTARSADGGARSLSSPSVFALILQTESPEIRMGIGFAGDCAMKPWSFADCP